MVRDLSRRFRATGSVAAKPHGGGQKLKTDAQTIRRLEALVARHNDLTYDGVPPATVRSWQPLEPR